MNYIIIFIGLSGMISKLLLGFIIIPYIAVRIQLHIIKQIER